MFLETQLAAAAVVNVGKSWDWLLNIVISIGPTDFHHVIGSYKSGALKGVCLLGFPVDLLYNKAFRLQNAIGLPSSGVGLRFPAIG